MNSKPRIVSYRFQITPIYQQCQWLYTLKIIIIRFFWLWIFLINRQRFQSKFLSMIWYWNVSKFYWVLTEETFMDGKCCSPVAFWKVLIRSQALYRKCYIAKLWIWDAKIFGNLDVGIRRDKIFWILWPTTIENCGLCFESCGCKNWRSETSLVHVLWNNESHDRRGRSLIDVTGSWWSSFINRHVKITSVFFFFWQIINFHHSNYKEFLL